MTEMITETRRNAFQTVGANVTGSETAVQAMESAGLANWNLRKAPLFAENEKGQFVNVGGQVAVLRDNPKSGETTSMGVVGPTYHIIQNEAHAELLDKVAERSGAAYENAGHMQHGKKVFITMRLPQRRMVGGRDPVDNFIAAVNGHDGSMAFHFMTTPVRFNCANMLNVGLDKSSSAFRIRHSSGAAQHLEAKAFSTVEHSMAYLDEFYAMADEMVKVKMSKARFEEIVRGAFGAPEGAAQNTRTRCENKVEQMLHLFNVAETNEEIRGTVWAGFNAITEYHDHFASTRNRERSEALATRAILDPKSKNTAMMLMANEL